MRSVKPNSRGKGPYGYFQRVLMDANRAYNYQSLTGSLLGRTDLASVQQLNSSHASRILPSIGRILTTDYFGESVADSYRQGPPPSSEHVATKNANSGDIPRNEEETISVLSWLERAQARCPGLAQNLGFSHEGKLTTSGSRETDIENHNREVNGSESSASNQMVTERGHSIHADLSRHDPGNAEENNKISLISSKQPSATQPPVTITFLNTNQEPVNNNIESESEIAQAIQKVPDTPEKKTKVIGSHGTGSSRDDNTLPDFHAIGAAQDPLIVQGISGKKALNSIAATMPSYGRSQAQQLKVALNRNTNKTNKIETRNNTKTGIAQSHVDTTIGSSLKESNDRNTKGIKNANTIQGNISQSKHSPDSLVRPVSRQNAFPYMAKLDSLQRAVQKKNIRSERETEQEQGSSHESKDYRVSRPSIQPAQQVVVYTQPAGGSAPRHAFLERSYLSRLGPRSYK